jgi:nitroimidazol reductase NimA-like FMN-containing flavoprotein (pyridoxamine 5'-phosphate oxidase superfamily)
MTVEELHSFGLRRMDDGEVRDFLANQGFGVLGLVGEDAPYLVPLSYGFDGEASLYFTYLQGADSRKEALSERGATARFLVYAAETAFNWRSVLLTGTIQPIPRSEWPAISADLSDAWRPDLLERASEELSVSVYAFRVDERTGIKHAGLPPDFEEGGDGS